MLAPSFEARNQLLSQLDDLERSRAWLLQLAASVGGVDDVGGPVAPVDGATARDRLHTLTEAIKRSERQMQTLRRAANEARS